MSLSLRYRLWLSFGPLLLLLTVLGVAAVLLLRFVGDRIDAILRENYRSVAAMVGLNEALDRIDSSFQLALLSQQDARDLYESNWSAYRDHLRFQQGNLTEPGEDQLVARLEEATQRYRSLGDRFFGGDRAQAERVADYVGSPEAPGPLRDTFGEIKELARQIRELNQSSMESASEQARSTARAAQLWSFLGLLAAVSATGLVTWHVGRTILRPVEELTRSVRAVGEGRLDRRLQVTSRDELGVLVESFNRMTAQLRELRQSHSATLRRVQQASQATIDAFPDPVVVIDPAGRVEMANPAASRTLGVVTTAGQPAPTWYPPESLRQPLADALKSGRTLLTYELGQTVTFRAAGEELSFLPRVLPIRDPLGDTLGAAVVLHDVTRFRLLDELKSNLVATASHELKTPLTSIRLAVHVLLSEAVGPLTPKQTELLLDARENTERLVRVIDHLLSLARLEHIGDQITLRPENPVALLETAADAIRPLADGKHLTIEVVAEGTLPPVAADALRLGHALNNLLANAVTYTEPGGRITLSARRGAEGHVELAVRDTGVGIPSEYVAHVFDRFFRIPGQSREHGTGLGLAIVREIALAHHGDVRCESEAGKGTTFTLTLPVAAGPPATGAI